MRMSRVQVSPRLMFLFWLFVVYYIYNIQRKREGREREREIHCKNAFVLNYLAGLNWWLVVGGGGG